MTRRTPPISLLALALVAAVPAHAVASPNEDLAKAIFADNLEGAKAALAAGADPNAPDPNGNQPLAAAVWNVEITKALLAAKADPSRFNPSKMMNGLMAAANWGEVETVKLHLAAKADPTLKNSNGYTALHFAAFNSSSLPTIAALVEGGAEWNAPTLMGLTPFHLVLKEARTPADKVKQLNGMTPYIVKAGVTLPERVKNPQESQFSSIASLITFFIDKGVDINAPITFQLTDREINELRAKLAPKFTGSAAKHLADVLDEMRKTKVVTYPILMAAEKGKLDAMQVLAEKGARLTVKGSLGASAVWYAAAGGNFEAWKAIKAKAGKVDVNEADKMDVSILMAAAMGGSGEIVEDLLAGGAKIDAVDKYGGTALHYAAAHHRADPVKVLLAHKANFNLARRTIEAMDIQSSHVSGAYTERHTRYTTTTYKQTTPLGIARSNAQNPQLGDYTEVIHLLEAAGATALQ